MPGDTETEVLTRVKKLRTTQATALTKLCNKALQAFTDGRSKATLRDMEDNIRTARANLEATNELYILSSPSIQDVQKAKQWMQARYETAEVVLLDIQKQLRSSDVKSVTTVSEASESVSLTSVQASMDRRVLELQAREAALKLEQTKMQAQLREQEAAAKMNEELLQMRLKNQSEVQEAELHDLKLKTIYETIQPQDPVNIEGAVKVEQPTPEPVVQVEAGAMVDDTVQPDRRSIDQVPPPGDEPTVHAADLVQQLITYALPPDGQLADEHSQASSTTPVDIHSWLEEVGDPRLNPHAAPWEPVMNDRPVDVPVDGYPTDVPTELPRPPTGRGGFVQTTPIDAWIDALIPGQETVLSPTSIAGTMNERLLSSLVKMESDRSLPAATIPVFDGSALIWPKFVEQFYTHVHCKPGIDDARRMDLLQSHVSGDAQRMVNGIGYSGRCYAHALQELKRTFGHWNLVARAYLDQIAVGGVIPSRNPTAFRQLYIDVRDCIITLQQLSYTSDLLGTDLLLRVAKRLPADKVRYWNRHVTRLSKTKEPSLFDFQDWLKETVEIDFNPYSVKLDSGKKDKGPNKRTYTCNAASTKPQGKTVVKKDKTGASGKALPKSSQPASSQSRPVGGTNSRVSEPYPSQSHELSSSKSTTGQSHKRTAPQIICPLYKNSHYLYRCFKFVNKMPEERRKIVGELGLCLNCLRPHKIEQCTSSLRCKEEGCGEAHHTLTHVDPTKTVKNASCNIASENSSPSRTYFQLVKVYACGNNRRWLPTVALLDSASEISVIHRSLAQDLGLRGKQRRLTITTMNAETTTTSQVVSFKLRSADDMDGRILQVKDAWSVGDETFQCPSQEIPPEWDHVKGLGLTRIEASEVKILLGVNVPEAHIQLDVRSGKPTQPVAVRTQLGWSLMGVMTFDEVQDQTAKINLLLADDQQLHQQIQRFWSTEAFGVTCNSDVSLSAEDKQALEILNKSTRLVDGHFEVGMLWRDYTKPESFPDDKDIAARRYYILEKRLRKNADVKHLYSETLNGYVSKGFARKLSALEAEQISPRTWYIPHHGVTSPSKPGKIRVVFDAAASCSGTSLNDKLMTGPDLLNSLFGVLQRLRLYKVAICADIEGMFHQVKVPECDSDALRFLWKENIDNPGPPDTYKMVVHNFGAADSPTCANYALQRTATDHQEQHSPEAVDTVVNSFYVDDLAKSIDTPSDAVQLAKEIVALLQKGGFRLHKWISNSIEFLEQIEESERTMKNLDLSSTESIIQRTLGLKWDVNEDLFVFQCQPKNNQITKRGVVSTVSSIFDPCGYVAPFVFRAKLLIQDIWRRGLGWDEPLSDDLEQKWTSWLQELSYLSSFRIPRHHINFTPRVDSVQLHVFADASESGFGAVAYLRFHTDTRQVECSLLASKTRVAPLKPALSIPRLELQGAVAATRLGRSLEKELHLPHVQSSYWSDSTTVLRYIKNESRRFKAFVANRIAEILETTSPEQWRYIPTQLNPADPCSRGLEAAKLCNSQQWQSGPQFLHGDEDKWPSLEDSSKIGEVSADGPEVRKVNATTADACADLPDSQQKGKNIIDSTSLLDPSHFSSLQTLVRRTAWLNRAILNFASVIPRLHLKAVRTGSLSPSDYQHAETAWVRRSQQDAFPDDLANLRQQESISYRSSLLPLDPFYDVSCDALRVGGRLRKANIPQEAKHQLILPANHPVTKLLFRDFSTLWT